MMLTGQHPMAACRVLVKQVVAPVSSELPATFRHLHGFITAECVSPSSHDVQPK